MKITGTARAGLTPTGHDAALASGRRRRSSAIVRLMNQPSDNYIAEMLIKGLGAQFGDGGHHDRGRRR